MAVVNFVVASAMTIVVIALLIDGARDARAARERVLGTFVYLMIAFFLRPRPNLDNVGWLGGLVDHPFRFSDDLNRGLGCLFVVLLPGRYVAESIVQFFQWRNLPAETGAGDADEKSDDSGDGGA